VLEEDGIRQVRPIVWEKEKLLWGMQEERNILHAVQRRSSNWIAHILRGNCLLNTLFNER
jgi:hypothetical protein